MKEPTDFEKKAIKALFEDTQVIFTSAADFIKNSGFEKMFAKSKTSKRVGKGSGSKIINQYYKNKR